MYSRKKQRDFILKEHKKALLHLELFVQKRDQEELHQFRVSIKKIEALIHLYKSIHKRFTKEVSDPIRSIFRKAGEIRDNAVSIEILIKNRLGNSELAMQLVRENKKRIQRFCAGEKKIRDRLENAIRCMRSALRPIAEAETREAIKRELIAASKIISKKHGISELHVCRKRIKRVRYIYEYFSGASLRNKLKLNSKELDRLQDRLGKLHDMDVTQQILVDVKNKLIPGQEVLRRKTILLKKACTKELKKYFNTCSFISIY